MNGVAILRLQKEIVVSGLDKTRIQSIIKQMSVHQPHDPLGLLRLRTAWEPEGVLSTGGIKEKRSSPGSGLQLGLWGLRESVGATC